MIGIKIQSDPTQNVVSLLWHEKQSTLLMIGNVRLNADHCES